MTLLPSVCAVVTLHCNIREQDIKVILVQFVLRTLPFIFHLTMKAEQAETQVKHEPSQVFLHIQCAQSKIHLECGHYRLIATVERNTVCTRKWDRWEVPVCNSHRERLDIRELSSRFEGWPAVCQLLKCVTANNDVVQRDFWLRKGYMCGHQGNAFIV